MKTKSLNIVNLNVPCQNRCRYCLLSWDGKPIGVEYERSVAYADGFYRWLKQNRPDVRFTYYFGYSMEHPRLIDAIEFMQKTNSPGGRFLQFDGMKMRTDEQLTAFVGALKKAGITDLGFTFYGIKEYHDRFAGRAGDFDLMIRTVAAALNAGVEVQVGIPVTKENLGQLDELASYFSNKQVRLFLFAPHSGGRGIRLISSKITLDDYSSMSDGVKAYFNRNNHKTPWEWLKEPPKEVESRALTLSLLPAEMEKLEKQPFEQTLRDLEKMDEDYFSVIPSFNELLFKYADENDPCLYTKKDLYMLYRKRFIEQNGLRVTDVTDERFSGSIRY